MEDYGNDIEQKMIDEEYSSDLCGCLSLLLYIAVAIGILGAIYIFT